ncbi:MAG: chloride channel protein, partial [Firmicutes bacterium]|nr:chloride channel protein [Bacillota bacterium]
GKQWICLLATVIASFITWGISRLAGVSYVDFHHVLTGGVTEAGSTSDIAAAAALVRTGMTAEVVGKVVLIALVAMAAGRSFCLARRVTTAGFELISNPWIRVLVGTGIVICVTVLIGNADQNGIGFVYVDHVLDGRSAMLAFLWKLLLTTMTLGCGIRGGEIAPTVFIGATGCFAAGCLIGLNPSLAAAVGIVGALASVTNCPIAIWIYGLEAIDASPEMALYFGIAACIAHFLSGTGGLYAEQPAQNQWLKPAKIR